jgi:NDP-sugar pyrophosphorylase family protein
MAGGKGTRLAPYSTVLPKPLMPIDDCPILEVVIRQLRFFGYTRVTICVGHLAELIMAFFGRGERWDVTIDYAIEDRPLGTMGALRRIRIPDEPFLVMNGDVLTDLDYAALYEDHLSGGSPMTIASIRRHVDVSLGVLDYREDRRLCGFREKPRIAFDASMGVYVLDPQAVAFIPEDRAYGFDDLVKDMLSADQPPRVFPFDGLWLDIGRREDYEVATETFCANRAKFMRIDDTAGGNGSCGNRAALTV